MIGVTTEFGVTKRRRHMQSFMPIFYLLAFMTVGEFLFRRWMPVHESASSRRCGQKNALICGAGIVGSMGLLTLAIWGIFKQPILSSCIIAAGIVWIFTFSAGLIVWRHGRATSGPVLLDCVANPLRKLGFYQAAIFLCLGIFGFVRLSDLSVMWGVASALFGVTAAVFWSLAGSGRLQIRENGIWLYYGLLKWDRIQSYKWDDDSLVVVVRTRFPPLGTRALEVPGEHKSSMEDFLTNHCPPQNNA